MHLPFTEQRVSKLRRQEAFASATLHPLVGIFDRILEKIPPQFGVHFRMMTAERIWPLKESLG
jgi:hypothetical protein